MRKQAKFKYFVDPDIPCLRLGMKQQMGLKDKLKGFYHLHNMN